MNLKVRILNAAKTASRKFVRFGGRQMRLLMVGIMMGVCAFAQAQTGKGGSGFTSATNEISSYAGPVQKLLYAIAGIIALVGAFNVYFKMQNGDQDVKKTIMMTIGGCVAMVAMATALPLFFK